MGMKRKEPKREKRLQRLLSHPSMFGGNTINFKVIGRNQYFTLYIFQADEPETLLKRKFLKDVYMKKNR